MVFTHKKAVKAELSRCIRAAVLWEGLLSWCCKETVTIHEAPRLLTSTLVMVMLRGLYRVENFQEGLA